MGRLLRVESFRTRSQSMGRTLPRGQGSRREDILILKWACIQNYIDILFHPVRITIKKKTASWVLVAHACHSKLVSMLRSGGSQF
jgi:hypothetical protein